MQSGFEINLESCSVGSGAWHGMYVGTDREKLLKISNFLGSCGWATI